MSLRTRLYLVCAALIAVIALPAAYGLRQLAELRDIAFDLQRNHAAAFLAVGRLQTSLAELNRLQRSYVATQGPDDRTAIYEQLDLAQLYLTGLAESGYPDRAASEQARLDSLQAATTRLDSLIDGDRLEEATAFFQGIKPMFDRAQESLSIVAETIGSRSNAEAGRASQISATATTTATVGLVVALGIALLLGLGSVGALTAPLRRLRTAMATVAGGRFVPPEDLPYERSDEIGDLSRSFRTMTDQLAELDRVKAEFVSIASHELKTPVNVIRGYAEMMEDGFYGELEEKQKEVLGYIGEQTQALAERVNQLLSMSRMEARGLEIELQEVRVRDLLQEIRHAFEALAVQQGIEFSVEADASTPDVVRLDPSRVRNELLGNLLSNAFKFTPRGGEIHLRSAGRGERLVLELKDTGEGISDAELPFIFEKYYQAGTHAGKIGTGLGLAIAREIVEAHGGAISARSEPSSGTLFRIELPVAGAPLDGPAGRLP